MFFNQLIRKTYDYVIHLSANKYALAWLFVISFVESSFFPIPPDIMLIPMILATPKKAWKIAGVCTLASILGAYLGYAIGLFFFQLIAEPLLQNHYHCQRRCPFEFSRIYRGLDFSARPALFLNCLAVKGLWRKNAPVHRKKPRLALGGIFNFADWRLCFD